MNKVTEEKFEEIKKQCPLYHKGISLTKEPRPKNICKMERSIIEEPWENYCCFNKCPFIYWLNKII